MERLDILSMDMEELNNYILSIGEKKFRAAQIYEWLHVKLASSFSDMSNLSKNLREVLERDCIIRMPRILEMYESKIDGTRKYLFGLYDGCVIESVLMKYKHGNSVCISSQVGCRMGCRFCASTIDGLERNLTPSEMIGQIYMIQKDIGERVSNIVVMGSGEPFDNYDNLIRFIGLITSEKGLNISSRNITVSTCGLVPNIIRFADEKLQVTLAISLHAPNDEKRREIMPVANKYSIDEILKACHYFYDKTKRRITFEYSLIEHVNDSKEEALALAKLLQKLNCHVNLIPVNPIKERDYKHSKEEYIMKFKRILEDNKVNVTIRREMGADINAACGQLRRSYIKEQKE